jgi:hypothetical protein
VFGGAASPLIKEAMLPFETVNNIFAYKTDVLE